MVARKRPLAINTGVYHGGGRTEMKHGRKWRPAEIFLQRRLGVKWRLQPTQSNADRKLQ